MNRDNNSSIKDKVKLPVVTIYVFILGLNPFKYTVRGMPKARASAKAVLVNGYAHLMMHGGKQVTDYYSSSRVRKVRVVGDNSGASAPVDGTVGF